MALYSYLSLDQIKAELAADQANVTDARKDTEYRRVLENVAQLIDKATGRTFRTYLAARTYTPRESNRVDVDDLVSVTQLATDPQGDGTFPTVWAASDYQLMPINALVDREPYTRILAQSSGRQSFSRLVNSARVTGLWGWPAAWEALPSVLTAGVAAATAILPITTGTDADVLDTLVLDSEQVYVIGRIGTAAPNELIVVRGVNGTTAAAHAAGAAIERVTYHPTVAEAARLQANRLLRRGEAPFGVIQNPMQAPMRLTAELDPDVRQAVGTLRKLRIGAVL